MKVLESKNKDNADPQIWAKLFEINEKRYCYDVGTNHIMEVDDVLYEVLKKYNYSNKKRIAADLSSRYSVEDIERAVGAVDEFSQAKGGFILQKRIRLAFPFSQREYKFLLEHFLSHLILNITEDCNLRCKYCAFSGSYKYRRTHKKVSMPWPVIQKAVDFFIPRTVLRINELKRPVSFGFYGGEPLLEPGKMFKTVEYVRHRWPDIFPEINFAITTNGTLLSREIIDPLIKYNFGITISLDGYKELHDKSRIFMKGGGTYDIIMKNIDLIKKIDREYFRQRVFFAGAMSPPYDLHGILEYFRREFPNQEIPNVYSLVDEFDTDFFDNFDMDEENRKYAQQSFEARCEFIKKKMEGEDDPILSGFIQDNTMDIHNRKLFSLPEATYPNGCCPPGLKKLFVDTEGRFHVCERVNSYFSIGDLDNGFDIPKIFDLIDGYSKAADHWKYCWAIRFCNSCFVSVIEGDHFSRERKKTMCERTKGDILSRLVTYVYLAEHNPRLFDKKYFRGEDTVGDLVKYLQQNKLH